VSINRKCSKASPVPHLSEVGKCWACVCAVRDGRRRIALIVAFVRTDRLTTAAVGNATLSTATLSIRSAGLVAVTVIPHAERGTINVAIAQTRACFAAKWKLFTTPPIIRTMGADSTLVHIEIDGTLMSLPAIALVFPQCANEPIIARLEAILIFIVLFVREDI
jgi:hypothetical protein